MKRLFKTVGAVLGIEDFAVGEDGITLSAAQIESVENALAERDKRNEELLKVLSQQSGVTKKNVKVITAPANALSSHRGKAMYKVTIDVQ